MKWIGTKNIGLLLLAIWLITSGVMVIFQINFAQSGLILAILAVAAGICLLLGR